jgi:dihydrofolate reductase
MSRNVAYSMQVSLDGYMEDPNGAIDWSSPDASPAVVGGGKPFFPPLDQRLQLELVDTRRFDSGVVYLRYRT